MLTQKPYLYCEHDPVNALDPTGHLPGWLQNVIHYGENIGVVIVGVAAGAVLVPVGASLVVVVGTGALIGAVTGALIAANNYYWGHADLGNWDNGDLGSQVGIGAGMGAVTGGISGPLRTVLVTAKYGRVFDSTDGLWGRGSIQGW